MVKKLTQEQIIAQIPEARKRGQETMSLPWWPMNVVFDRHNHAIAVTMRSGFIFMVPTNKLRELRGATVAQLSGVEVQADSIRWDDLDVDISMPGLLSKAIGKNMLATETGRAGGMATTEAKAAAARVNGLLGGRPRKESSSVTPARVYAKRAGSGKLTEVGGKKARGNDGGFNKSAGKFNKSAGKSVGSSGSRMTSRSKDTIKKK